MLLFVLSYSSRAHVCGGIDSGVATLNPLFHTTSKTMLCLSGDCEIGVGSIPTSATSYVRLSEDR